MKGYFVHDKGLCESTNIGDSSRIWAFAHILPGAVIGRDCNICDHVFIENDVVLGDRVTIKSGVQLWDGTRLEDDVFVGPNATFTNDRHPRSKQYPARFLQTRVRAGASIGANATILPGITIGQHAMIGAGTVVTQTVPAYATIIGNPARIVGYVNASNNADEPAARRLSPSAADRLISTGVADVTLHHLPLIKDLRGDLSVAEFNGDIPFAPLRYFLVFDVPSARTRGQHAHRQCHQFLVCTKGSVSILVDDGQRRCEVTLDRPNLGLHVPPMVWGVQYKYTADAVLMVFASHHYDPEDYIRDYDEFLDAVNRLRR